MTHRVRRAAFWALVPLIVPQGLLLKRSAPRFPPAVGPHQGKIGGGNGGTKIIRILAIGDSIIAGVGAPRVELALPGQVAHALAQRLACAVSWEAIGEIGLDARTVLRKLVPLIPPYAFDMIVVSVGVNDVTSLKRSFRWCADLADLLDALSRHSPRAVIALMGVPPLGSFPLLRPPLRTAMGIRAKSFDAIAQGIAAQRDRVIHIPLEIDPRPEKFAADGYHPSVESYRELGNHVAEMMAPLLTKQLAQ